MKNDKQSRNDALLRHINVIRSELLQWFETGDHFVKESKQHITCGRVENVDDDEDDDEDEDEGDIEDIQVNHTWDALDEEFIKTQKEFILRFGAAHTEKQTPKREPNESFRQHQQRVTRIYRSILDFELLRPKFKVIPKRDPSVSVYAYIEDCVNWMKTELAKSNTKHQDAKVMNDEDDQDQADENSENNHKNTDAHVKAPTSNVTTTKKRRKDGESTKKLRRD